MKKRIFKVPFYTLDKCFNRNFALVEAIDPQDAFDQVKMSIDNRESLYKKWDASWDGINSVTIEVTDTEETSIEEEDIDEIKEIPKGIERLRQLMKEGAFVKINGELFYEVNISKERINAKKCEDGIETNMEIQFDDVERVKIYSNQIIVNMRSGVQYSIKIFKMFPIDLY